MVIFAISSLASYLYIGRIDSDVRQIVEVEQPLEQAVLEMEINAGETARAVLDYVREPLSEHREIILDSEADFERYAETFERLAETDEERWLGREVATLYTDFKALGDEILALTDQRRAAFGVFSDSHAMLDELIEEGLLPSIVMSEPGSIEKLHIAVKMAHALEETAIAIALHAVLPQEFLHGMTEFKGLVALYRKSSTSADEKSLLSRIDETSATLERAGGEVMTLNDAMYTLLEEFEQDLWQIGAILDDRIQPLIHAETIGAAADAKASTAAAALTLLILGAIALLVGSGSAWALSRGILAPVRALVSGTMIIGEGTLTHRISIASKDEFGQLAESFNRMVEKLQGAQGSVEQARAHLEQRVEERSRELQREPAEHKRAKEALQRSEERFRDIAEAASDLFWKTGPDHRFTYVSERFFETMQVTPKAVIGSSRRNLISDSERETDPEKWRRHFEDLDAHRPFSRLEYAIVGGDGKERYIKVSGVPVFDATGRFLGYRGADTDITERRGSEQHVQAATEQAEIANRFKSEFLANMSHELRTPLNAIIGFSNIIRDETFGPVGNPKYAEYITDINSAGEHLLAIINDILDLSKIEAGKVELHEESVDVVRILESCSILLNERAQRGGVSLNSDIADNIPPLYADKRKLRQILINLLSNAVKFTPAGGTVAISAWSRPDAGYVFQIADTGIGIALEDIPKVLAPFHQIDSRLGRQYEGTGLGLPLTRSLVELHGGSLDLQSEPGAGTTVTVRFPEARVMPEDAARQVIASR